MGVNLYVKKYVISTRTFLPTCLMYRNTINSWIWWKIGTITGQNYFFGWHRSPLRSDIFCEWVSESVMESTAFHHVPVGGSWWNFNTTCVLVISCHPQRVEVIGQKVKGHGSKMRSFWGIFGLKKKLGSHRSEFGSAILDLGPLNKYKKTQEIKFWIFWLFLEKMSKNSQK